MKIQFSQIRATLCALALASTTLLLPTSISAFQITSDICETPSHGRATLGHDYYDLSQYYVISDESSAALNAFYARLEGRWTGEMIDRPCTGIKDEHPREPKHFLFEDITTDLRDDGLFILRGEKKRIELRSGSKRSNVVSIMPSSRIDFLPGRDLSALEMPDDNTVTAVARYQQRNAASQNTPRTSLRERQDTLILVDDTLLIQTRWYINGFYTGTESLRLTRHH